MIGTASKSKYLFVSPSIELYNMYLLNQGLDLHDRQFWTLDKMNKKTELVQPTTTIKTFGQSTKV